MTEAYGPSVMPKLVELHNACLKQQVSYSVNFNECNHTWDVSIDSPAPSERYLSRDYSDLGDCLDLALKHLHKIAGGT